MTIAVVVSCGGPNNVCLPVHRYVLVDRVWAEFCHISYEQNALIFCCFQTLGAVFPADFLW